MILIKKMLVIVNSSSMDGSFKLLLTKCAKTQNKSNLTLRVQENDVLCRIIFNAIEMNVNNYLKLQKIYKAAIQNLRR